MNVDSRLTVRYCQCLANGRQISSQNSTWSGCVSWLRSRGNSQRRSLLVLSSFRNRIGSRIWPLWVSFTSDDGILRRATRVGSVRSYQFSTAQGAVSYVFSWMSWSRFGPVLILFWIKTFFRKAKMRSLAPSNDTRTALYESEKCRLANRVCCRSIPFLRLLLPLFSCDLVDWIVGWYRTHFFDVLAGRQDVNKFASAQQVKD